MIAPFGNVWDWPNAVNGNAAAAAPAPRSSRASRRVRVMDFMGIRYTSRGISGVFVRGVPEVTNRIDLSRRHEGHEFDSYDKSSWASWLRDEPSLRFSFVVNESSPEPGKE